MKANPLERLLWCNTHERKATVQYEHADKQLHWHCEGGGITLPCRVVDLTDELEFYT